GTGKCPELWREFDEMQPPAAHPCIFRAICPLTWKATPSCHGSIPCHVYASFATLCKLITRQRPTPLVVHHLSPAFRGGGRFSRRRGKRPQLIQSAAKDAPWSLSGAIFRGPQRRCAQFDLFVAF